MARRRIVVSGRVQGVGFRWFVSRQAKSLGIAGWVRNNPDGTVELEAEGEVDALDKLEAALRQGPRLADVEDVKSVEVPPRGEGGFRIVF